MENFQEIRAGFIGERGGRGAALFVATLLAGCSAAPPAAIPASSPVESPALPPRAPAGDGSIVVVTVPEPAGEFRSTPFQADLSNPPERDSSGRFAFERFSFDAEWIPAIWVTADIEQNGSTTRADFDTGSGLALRAGMGTDQQNIGVLYIGSWADEKTTGRGAETRSLLLDFLYRAPIPETGGAIWFAVDAGLGATELRFDSNQFDDVVTGAALLHGDLEFRITRAFTVAAGLGGFIWGHFGDTEAYGSYVTLGAKLIF
jgi:hypothetical protein